MPIRCLGGQTLPVAAWHAPSPRGAHPRPSFPPSHTPSLGPRRRYLSHVTPAAAAPSSADGTRGTRDAPPTPNLHMLATALQRYSAPMASLAAAALCLTIFGSSSAGLPFASATVAKQLSPAASAVAISSAWAGLAAGCLHTLAGRCMPSVGCHILQHIPQAPTTSPP